MTMIEQVARALAEDDCNWGDFSPDEVRDQIEHDWPMWVSVAKAALKAMREPTASMREDGAAMLGIFGATNIYQAMIDAALEEGE